MHDGYSVAPFKAQNVSNNSYVTSDGGEIGRAQGVQAEAAGVAAAVEMNPILIKPKQDMESQIIVREKPVGDMSARGYHSGYLQEAEAVVKQCLLSLLERFEVVVIEGAGSPAEINLRGKDIANMKTAELADASVILVADIDRGGVFASLISTLELLAPGERKRVKGFIINKFRGDFELLSAGAGFPGAENGDTGAGCRTVPALPRD